MFARFEGKISIVVINKFPDPPLSWAVYFCGRVPMGDLKNLNSWWREYHQRNVAVVAIPPEVGRNPRFL